MSRCHSGSRLRSARVSNLRHGGRRLALRRQYAPARIGSGRDGAAFRPCLEIVDGIDDPSAELFVSRTGPVSAVLFERACGEAEEFGGFLGAEEARRQNGEIGSHGSAFRGVAGGRWGSAADGDHDGEEKPASCRAKLGGPKIPHRRDLSARLRSAAMTKQFAIAASDEGAGIPEKRHYGMSVRRGLPFVATEATGVEDDPCDLLLGRSVAMSIKRA